LHVKCIAEAAAAQAGDGDGSTPRKKSEGDEVQIGPTWKGQAKASKGGMTAEVMVERMPHRLEDKLAERTEILITDENGEQRSGKVACLYCQQIID
jgi:hypothetical protein